MFDWLLKFLFTEDDPRYPKPKVAKVTVEHVRAANERLMTRGSAPRPPGRPLVTPVRIDETPYTYAPPPPPDNTLLAAMLLAQNQQPVTHQVLSGGGGEFGGVWGTCPAPDYVAPPEYSCPSPEPAPAPAYEVPSPAPSPTYESPAPSPSYEAPAPSYEAPAPSPSYDSSSYSSD
jgi:hypothetical protein